VTDSKALYWHERRWAVKTLVALGKPREAIDYALATDDPYRPTHTVAKVCESILLDMGLIEEAYEHYALGANQSTTNVATYKAIVKSILASVLRRFCKTWSIKSHYRQKMVRYRQKCWLP
jgi:hypothetical protein